MRSKMAGCLQPVRIMRRRVSRFHGEWLPRKPPQGHREEAPQSGVLPEIRLEGESVVFYLDIAAGRGPARLVLRCDSTGNVWSSIAPAAGVDGQAGEEDDEPAA